MRVDELRLILDHLPADVEVFIEPTRGFTGQITSVWRNPSRPWDGGAMLSNPNRYKDPGRLPGDVHLASRVPWWRPVAPFDLHGQFRRAAQLERDLDALAGGGPG